ncbi:uncharacterized protein Tco025E_04308, partial [Trypanosoma conorhini]
MTALRGSCESYVFYLTLRQITVRQPQLARDNAVEKYEPRAELLVRWAVGSAQTGRALFPADVTESPLEGAGGQGRGRTLLTLGPSHEIVIQERLRRKPARGRGREEARYE